MKSASKDLKIDTLADKLVNPLQPYKTRPIKLVQYNFKKLVMRQSHQTATKMINAMDISADGNFVVTSDDEDKVSVFDLTTGELSEVVHSKKYGCDLVVFSKEDLNALHSSTKQNDVIRYLSLEKKAYIRYFSGHSERVISMSTSPIHRQFLSGSQDSTIRAWDVRVSASTGVSTGHLNPLVAYDPVGLIYAVATSDRKIGLYDIRAQDVGPFASFDLVRNGAIEKDTVTGIKFSPDGKNILITTDFDYCATINAFSGNRIRRYTDVRNASHSTYGACYTPCGTHIFVGGEDGRFACYDTNSGECRKKWRSEHTQMVRQLIFHPKYFMLMTASTDIMFWTYDDPIGPNRYGLQPQ
uniref:WD_REPEATS_REGION domain-containing protein n=1 Tax=Rhabditophanes sp. KR3021 TaxID=114890 RepID=A0AC35THC2_9BILA